MARMNICFQRHIKIELDLKITVLVLAINEKLVSIIFVSYLIVDVVPFHYQHNLIMTSKKL